MKEVKQSMTGLMEGDDDFLRYLQGDLSLGEMEEFERGAAPDAERADTIRGYSQLLDRLSDQLADVVPEPGREARDRILAATRIKMISHVVRADEDLWAESGQPGIQFKLLYKEPETGRLTVLGRLAPGARMPVHRHVGCEECLVLEGSLYTDGVLLHAGDYIVTQNDTVHEETWSEDGALVLLKTMMADEILA